jgi:two-component system, cell cycle sensor histidine kinase and response regulator CckA
MEKQFLRAQRLESIGALAGGIAHDLNNVLAPILMAVPVLEREATDDNSRRKLEIIRRNAKLGGEIIQQLLSFARGGTGEQTALQPGKRIRQICQMLQRTMPKSIEVEISTPDDLWEITGDATQFDQMLMNLCVNARDAMPRGGHLRISAENVIIDAGFARMQADASPGPHVQIIVADTGTGIPPEIREKIFEPFFTTKEIDHGTGLGLATVLKIVKSHGGFIDVYSQVGRGTTFKPYLPARASAEAAAAEESKPELPAGHNELILVVDDEATIREIARDTLTTFGYRVTTASDGTEAIALFAEHKAEIKAVLLDQMMPHMDGPSTIRALRHLDPQIRIIAMSGLPESARKAASAEEAVKAFLLKPYTATQLLQTLAEALRQN